MADFTTLILSPTGLRFCHCVELIDIFPHTKFNPNLTEDLGQMYVWTNIWTSYIW